MAYWIWIGDICVAALKGVRVYCSTPIFSPVRVPVLFRARATSLSFSGSLSLFLSIVLLSTLIMAVGSGMDIGKRTTAIVSRTSFSRRKKRRREFSLFFLHQYAAIETEVDSYWSSNSRRPPILSTISWWEERKRKEKFIRIFYCLLLQLARTRMYVSITSRSSQLVNS